MKRFLIFALLGPLLFFLCSMVFRFVMAWGGGGGLEVVVQSFLLAFALGLPPLLVAFGVNGMERWTTWPSRLKATAFAGLSLAFFIRLSVRALEEADIRRRLQPVPAVRTSAGGHCRSVCRRSAVGGVNLTTVESQLKKRWLMDEYTKPRGAFEAAADYIFEKDF